MVDTIEIIKTGRSEIEHSLNTSQNLYRFAWNKIFKEIKDNITDPKKRNSLFVYGSYPDWHIGEIDSSQTEIKDNYPLVVVENPTLSDYENQTMDYKTSQNSINIVIEIFSDRNDYLDNLSDQVLYTLFNNIQTNTSVGFHNMQIMNDSYNHYMRGGVKIHNRTFNIRFDVVRG